MGEPSQVAAWDFFGFDAEAFPGDSLLQREREEPVVPAGQEPGGYPWPGGQWPGLGEDRRPFRRGAGISAHHLSDRTGQVVEEQRLKIADIYLRPAVAAGHRLRFRLPADMVPPLTGRLAGPRNHRVEQHPRRDRDLL